MRITFIDPPRYKIKSSVERVFGCNLTIYPVPNIFTLSIISLLKKKGYDADYIDAANKGWGEKDLAQFLQRDESDILSVHSVNLSKDQDLKFLEDVRKSKGGIPVVFTGPAPTFAPKDYLCDNNTFVIRGEPEFTFIEFINRIFRKNTPIFSDIKGLSFVAGAVTRDNPPRELIENLDNLPFPSRELLDKGLYFNPKIGLRPWTVILTSRGCGFRCIYCVPCSLSFSRELEYRRFYGRKPPPRMRSAENVIEEFRLIHSQGYKAASIIDDNFISDAERVVKICEGIKPLGIVWGCLSRADLITERLASAMSSANCRYVDIGVESFDQDVLDYVKKDLKVETIFKAIEILRRFNIEIKLNILLGATPFETKEAILRNIEITKRLKASTVMFSIVSPFPGTEYYQLCKAGGWFKYGDYLPTNIQKKAIMDYPNISAEEMESLVRKANYKIYLDTDVVWNAVKKVRSPMEFWNGLVAYVRKLKFN